MDVDYLETLIREVEDYTQLNFPVRRLRLQDMCSNLDFVSCRPLRSCWLPACTAD